MRSLGWLPIWWDFISEKSIAQEELVEKVSKPKRRSVTPLAHALWDSELISAPSRCPTGSLSGLLGLNRVEGGTGGGGQGDQLSQVVFTSRTTLLSFLPIFTDSTLCSCYLLTELQVGSGMQYLGLLAPALPGNFSAPRLQPRKGLPGSSPVLFSPPQISTTDSLGKKPWFVVFANFYGEHTATTVDSKLLNVELGRHVHSRFSGTGAGPLRHTPGCWGHCLLMVKAKLSEFKILLCLKNPALNNRSLGFQDFSPCCAPILFYLL